MVTCNEMAFSPGGISNTSCRFVQWKTGIVEDLRILDDDSDENFDSINELVSLFRISRVTP